MSNNISIRPIYPIFLLHTRSFWLGILPAVLTLLDVMFSAASGDATAAPVAQSIYYILGHFLSWTPEEIHSVMKAMSPLYAFIVAQQRAGITRPYSATPVGKDPEPAAVIAEVPKADMAAIAAEDATRRP